MIKERTAFLLTLPFLLIFIFFVIYPLIYQIYISFTSKVAGLPERFTGLNNFIFLVNKDPYYLWTLMNTFIYVMVAVNIRLALALGLANLLNRQFRGRRIVRIIFLLPWAIPVIPALLTWYFIFSADWGFANYLLISLGLSDRGISWFGRYDTAMLTAILFNIWKNLPFWTLLFLAGLQSIPSEIYDAAKIDGTGAWTKFRYVTFPLIKRLYIINSVLSLMWTTGDFTTVWMLSRGNPGNRTHVLSTLAYNYGFLIGDLSTAAAMFTFILPLMIIVIFTLIKILERGLEK
ncbi:MAG: sugar ABC transporter permease [Nitrososphaeria archaeon]